jgi:hypothetical protein
LGDMGDMGMAIFHFFHRQKTYFENGSEAHHKSSWSSQELSSIL